MAPDLWKSILPVIDLQRGVVVRGDRGERNRYRPIISQLSDSAMPAAIAAGLRDQFHFQDVYVADLSALVHEQEPDWESYQAIAAQGLRIWLDAGLKTVDQAQRWRKTSGNLVENDGELIAHWIVPLETLESLEALQALSDLFGNDRVVFSLDLQENRLRTVRADWQGTSPIDLVEQVLEYCKRLIVLDLSAVGANSGPITLELCRQIRLRYGHNVELISGGGVRHGADLEAFALYCDRILVASALHDARLVDSEG